jgi:SAM-dependent methyltransferase
MLKFDAATARLLDDGYQGADVVKRRLATFDALAPAPGETIADIGCGPGLLLQEISRAIGDEGQAIGLDPSPEMRAAAAARCDGRDNVRILDGAVDALPLNDNSIDKAAALQVFEYLSDIPAALAEIRRVLRPGGRLVVGDQHWDTLAWASDEPDRMAAMIAAWDHHLVDRTVPAHLPYMMREAGYAVEAVTPLVCSATDLPADSLPWLMIHLMKAYVIENDLIPADTAEAWADEQARMAREGRFFFTLTHFVVSGRTL